MLGRLQTEEERIRLQEFQQQFAPQQEPIMEKVPELTTERCKRCHGTGTIFPFKSFKSKQCPVCKGKCKIPKGSQ